MLKSVLRIITGAAVCVLAACGGDERTDSLDINREYRSPRLRTDIRDAAFIQKLTWESTAEELENGFVRKTFPMPPGLAFSMSSVDISGSSDPFAVPLKPARPSKVGFREIFESAGIRFSEGSSVHYEEEKGALIVVNTSDQMALVDAYLESIGYDEETKLYIRAEIYEISHLQAIQLTDSAAHESEHTPEREAVLQAVREGRARLIAVPSVTGRSGQRSKVEVVSRNHSETSISSAEKESSVKEKPPGESGPASRFEVDPVLGADGYTIDLNFSLEHPIPVGPSEDDPKQTAGPGEFRQAGITSTVTLTHGSFVLAGSWDSGADSVQLVFLTATRQHLEDIKPMIKVDSGQK